MTEIWKPVVGWEGLYEVSDRGRMRSVDRLTVFQIKGVSATRFSRGKILKPRMTGGYLRVNLCGSGGIIKHKMVHIAVLDAFIGPCPEGLQARHLDGNATNPRLGNLKWGTWEENAEDKRRHGRWQCGERHGMAKLKDGDVREIRRRYALGGVRQVDLASEFGIAQTKISAIVRGNLWRHVT